MYSTIELYPKSRTSQLDLSLFRNPTSEYRGAPFWAWNNKLDINQLKRQILTLQEMGFGGYHMHSRTGVDTPYLSDEFMGVVKACVDYGDSLNMLSWLYDEDRWPSGFGGGFVTCDHRHRAKHLLWTTVPYGMSSLLEEHSDSTARATRAENGTLLAAFEVVVIDGVLKRYRLQPSELTERDPQATLWYAYLESAVESSWFNNQAYVDTLSRAAIERFIEVTHERYRETVGDRFGNSVPAIFTDEPQFAHKQTLKSADDLGDVVIPFSTDLCATYFDAYGQRLEDKLPELFWELPDGAASVVRYRYHDHLAERFASAFADTIGEWCERNGIALTGHMMEEPSLQSQTAALGEAMRSYRSFQLPGIDMLCDWHEYTTAKQAQSAAHQYGRGGVMSELYGVTNWDFDFVGHKEQGNWQAALGITLRVPHLAWVSMKGEAKRDYPASIGYQSPWYAEYKLIEDHFARLNVVLTRGKPSARVGVIHPIESYWLAFGPSDQTKSEREEREQHFRKIVEWLLFGLVDFDFIAESLLPSQSALQDSAAFSVGEMQYDVVVAPSLRTIRSSTLSQLEQFAQNGGKLVFAGEIPSLVDAEHNDRALKLAAKSTQVEFTKRCVLNALETVRDVDIRVPSGGRAESIVHQIRVDGDRCHLFFCNTDRRNGIGNASILIRGEWSATRLDTSNGEAEHLATRLRGSSEGASDVWTELLWSFPAHGDLLLTLDPGWREGGAFHQPKQLTEVARLAPHAAYVRLELDPTRIPVSLSEPNVLLLDQPEWRIEGIDEEWRPREESLRITNLARAAFDLPPFHGNIAQPWTDSEPASTLGYVSLRYNFMAEDEVEDAQLALEDARLATISLDGELISNTPDGWWVDESIETVPLPAFGAEQHSIVITIPFTRKTSLEWVYLLGDFGVSVGGRVAKIIEPVRNLAFGDWVSQGLPFYAGNIIYRCEVEGDGSELILEASLFKAPLLSVAVDGIAVGKIAFAPYQLSLGRLSPGMHLVEITVFGNRYNSFGQLHLIDPHMCWFGPESWRSSGDRWAYEYQLKPMGLLTAPRLLR